MELKNQVTQINSLIEKYKKEKSNLPEFISESVSAKIDQFVDGLEKQKEKIEALIAKEEKMAPINQLVSEIASLVKTRDEQKKTLEMANSRYKNSKGMNEKQKLLNIVTDANEEFLNTQKNLSSKQMELKLKKELLKEEKTVAE